MRKIIPFPEMSPNQQQSPTPRGVRLVNWQAPGAIDRIGWCPLPLLVELFLGSRDG